MPTIQVKYSELDKASDQFVSLTAALPAFWEICGECNGEGESSAYLGAFTGEQMSQDTDFAEDYFAGKYDRACSCCKGRGSILAIYRDACTNEHATVLKSIDEWEQAANDNAREVAAERRHMYGSCH